MRAGSRIRATILTGLFATSCGGGGDGGPPLTVDDFCTMKAEKECQVALRCTTPVADCKTARKDTCMAFATASAVAPRVFNQGNVGNCVAVTDALYKKTSPLTPTEFANVDDACNYVFQGNKKKGETCTNKYDCVDRVVCDKGRCADRVPRALGAMCLNFGEVCNPGSYCTMDTDGITKCLAKKAAGATCSAAEPCVEALRCAPSLMCENRVMAGEDCRTHDDCPTAAPYCDPYAGNKCNPGLLFATGSASCIGFTMGSSGGGGAGGGGAGGAGGSSDAGAGGADGGGTDAASGG